MKWGAGLLALFLALILGLAGAFALPGDIAAYIDALELSQADREALEALLDTIEENVPDDTLAALIDEFVGEYALQQESLVGYLTDDLYTHPLGFQLVIPKAWSISEDTEGTVVSLYADADEGGFMPILGITLLEEDALSLLSETLETRNEAFSDTLPGYETLSFETMLFQDVPAWEHVYLYDDPEQGSLMTHCFYFEKDELRVSIRMTTRSVDIEPWLDLYDAFLASFVTGV